LKAEGDPAAVEGMSRFGITGAKLLGISMPVLRRMGREIGTNRRLADLLWRSGYHEARIVAGLIEDPAKITPAQMDRWTAGFDSWDVCDQCCMNLYRHSPHAYRKAREWSRSDTTYVKRAGYALMATLAVGDKESKDLRFTGFFRDIQRGADDERAIVRKAVNWALRQIGKRSPGLNAAAIRCAETIRRRPEPGPRWVAADALRELRSSPVRRKLGLSVQ